MLSNPACKNAVISVVNKTVRSSQVNLTSMNGFHFRLKTYFQFKMNSLIQNFRLKRLIFSVE